MAAQQVRAGQRVVVVGAGITGLTAAFRLHQAGVEVLVLERADQVGGRMSSIDVDGFVIDIGAGILSYAYREMLELITDAGLAGMIEPAGGPLGVVANGQVHRFRSYREFLAGALLSDQARTAFRSILDEARGYHDLFDWSEIGRGVQLDTEDMAAYVERHAPAELMEYFIEPLCNDIWLESPRNLSVANLFFYLSRVVGKGFFNSPAGVGFLPDGLAKIVPVHTSAMVRAVEPRRDGVTVTWDELGGQSTTEDFDAGIVAVPAPYVPQICPELPSEIRELFAAITYARNIEVFVGLEHPPDEPAMWIQTGRSDPDLVSLVMDHHKAPSHVPRGRGLVSSFWRPDWCAQRWDDDDNTIVADALRTLDTRYPGLSDDVLVAHVQRWNPCIAVHEPGSFHSLTRLTENLDPDSRLHFAGDYFTISTTNSGVCSGARAARRVVAQLVPVQ